MDLLSAAEKEWAVTYRDIERWDSTARASGGKGVTARVLSCLQSRGYKENFVHFFTFSNVLKQLNFHKLLPPCFQRRILNVLILGLAILRQIRRRVVRDLQGNNFS